MTETPRRVADDDNGDEEEGEASTSSAERAKTREREMEERPSRDARVLAPYSQGWGTRLLAPSAGRHRRPRSPSRGHVHGSEMQARKSETRGFLGSSSNGTPKCPRRSSASQSDFPRRRSGRQAGRGPLWGCPQCDCLAAGRRVCRERSAAPLSPLLAQARSRFTGRKSGPGRG
jgi:hypothetical protein